MLQDIKMGIKQDKKARRLIYKNKTRLLQNFMDDVYELRFLYRLKIAFRIIKGGKRNVRRTN
jgi:hypothetical protein